MATRKPKPEATEARALVDVLGVKAGDFISADAETIAALVADGRADDHPDAVAYAKAQEH